MRKKKGQKGAVQLGLFEEEREEPLREAFEFYQHKHGWSNRLVAGDSLLVMNSFLEKEDMAGKVDRRHPKFVSIIDCIYGYVLNDKI